MQSIAYRKGDATAPDADGERIICHVCNDVGGWGKGFVLAVSRRWSEPEADYRAWHQQGEAGGFRLGALRLVRVEPTVLVANMIAQRGMRPNGAASLSRDGRVCEIDASDAAARFR
jgi:O-acetyl-ADP-ribose deacetylase (regulator of RNase III)